jgi:membrane protein YdbS with pleckstrin-like domain
MNKLSRKEHAKLAMKAEAEVSAVILAVIFALFAYGFTHGLPVDVISLGALFMLTWYFFIPNVWRWLEYRMACMEEANGTEDESEDSDGQAETARWRAIAGYFWMNQK